MPMKKTPLFAALLAIVAVGLAVAVRAGDLIPTRTVLADVSSTAVVWTNNAYANGDLVKIQAFDASGTNDTLTVTKVVKMSATRSLTNACATAALVANSKYSLDTTVSNEYLVPGDLLRFSFGSVTGSVCITRRVAAP